MASTFSFVRGATEIIFEAVMLPITITRERSQNFIVAEDNSVYVYDRGSTETFYAFKISTERSRNSFADIVSVTNFIENEAIFRLNPFTLTSPHNIDLGAGDGVSINVRWWGNKLKEVQGRVQIYDYDFFLRREN